jgi:hypothetical protein
MIMKKLILLYASIVCLSIAGCDSPDLNAVTDEIKTTAKSAAQSAANDAMSEAGLAAGGLLTTGNACLLAGQSEALCSCLSTELGSQLDAKHIEGLTAAIKSGLGGDVGAAIKGAGSIDPQTRAALAKCGTRAAISGAMGQ